MVQLFASQVEGRIYIYELYDSNYFFRRDYNFVGYFRKCRGIFFGLSPITAAWAGAWVNLGDEWGGGANQRAQGQTTQTRDPAPLISPTPTLLGFFAHIPTLWGPWSCPL